ncbi:MAG: phosphatase PAP2 family protein [Nanoarchaeota archaeon]|nr:phosphatase PAP2 family protein [Nanoarchaeota archaeon]
MTRNDSWMNAMFFSFAIFFMILLWVVIGTPKIDGWINEQIILLWNSSLTNFFISFGSYLKEILIGLAVIVVSFLFFCDRKKESLILSSGLVLGFVVGSLLKLVVQRSRPTNSLVAEVGYSFPSNHAVFAMVLFLFLIYFFRNKIRSYFLRFSLFFISGLLVLITGISRIYLNVHWFTDVVGGFALGVIVVSAIVISLR